MLIIPLYISYCVRYHNCLLRRSPFHLNCWIYVCKIVSIVLQLPIWCTRSIATSLVSFFILVTYSVFFYTFVSLARDLSISLIFSKNELFVSLILLFLFSISLTSFIFIISSACLGLFSSFLLVSWDCKWLTAF